VPLLILKLILSPALVVGASLAARRYGPKVGGWTAAFPIISGPILLFFAIEQGPAFAARAAAGTCLGTISLSAFALVYGRVARLMSRGPGRDRRWPVAMLAGWAAFAGFTLVLRGQKVPAIAAAALGVAALNLTARMLPDVRDGDDAPPPGWWDIPARALATAIMVLGLTEMAEMLGPTVSGLLAPFPVASSVLVGFAHGQAGFSAAERVLRGLVLGLQSFVAFCLVLSLLLAHVGIGWAFAAGLAVSCALQGIVLAVTRR
jgi:hypothetical protein